MTKTKSLCPCVMRCCSSLAKPSDDNILPCISNVITVACGLILANNRCPSFSLTCSISLSLIFSGAFSSGTSIISILEYAPSLFSYSAIACFQYFSFNLPTAKIVIFIIVLRVDNSYSTYPQVINLLTEFPLIITVMYINSVENSRFIYKKSHSSITFVDKSVYNVSISVCIIHNSG